MDDTVKVALRIRPLSENEITRGCQTCLETVPGEPQVVVRNSDKAFTYNYVFDEESKQEEVYNQAVRHLLSKLFKGYNVTILAYGQTGSGKTYSMGTCYNGKGEMGIIPRAISDLFDRISSDNEMDYKVSTSFMELYKEQLYDLLASATKRRDQCLLDIREDAKGVRIPGLTEVFVKNPEETIQSLIQGSSGRSTGATAMNNQSSRSHAIFTITLNISRKRDGGGAMVSKFHLVDLAGSERSKKTLATGERFKEGVNINKGLLALGNVISALGDGQQGFVSYRDSKLTRLLQDSLGGNSVTLMIACVSPADYNCEETVSTLRYADRARHIKNKPVVNQDPKAAEIQRLQKENAELRLQLIGSGGGSSSCSPEHENLIQENAFLLKKIRSVTEALNNALIEKTDMFEKGVVAEAARERLALKIEELSVEFTSAVKSVTEIFETSETIKKTQLSVLFDLAAKIADLQNERKNGDQEIRQREISSGQLPFYLSTHDTTVSSYHTPANGSVVSPITVRSLEEFHDEEEKHALQQAERNKELQELLRALAMKEDLAAQMAVNTTNLSGIPDSSESMKELTALLSSVQQERDHLHAQLKSAQEGNASNKISEQRRKRLQELESQIAKLRKKIVEQDRIIKIKEKSEKEVVVLNNEIQSMKASKVRLIRQMKYESDNFRSWKLQREKEMNKLRDQDRKNLNRISKMEQMHFKQQNVLKRKVEEAAAANKRLKDALLLQKQAHDRRNNPAGKTEKLQTWLTHELEVLVRTIEAESSRDKLVEDRAVICQQLSSLKESLETASSDELNDLKKEISQTEQELELRNIQISGLNQKIMDSDQETKSRTRWDGITSMAEAKCALKIVFDHAAEMAREAANKNYSIEELKDFNNSLSSAVNELKEQLQRQEQKHQHDILTLKREREDMVNALCEKRMEMKSPVPTTDNKENSLPAADNFLTPIPRSKPKPLKKTKYDIVEAEEDFLNSFTDGELDDDDDDPDWKRTPIFRRLREEKRKCSALAIKRTSQGLVLCSCGGACKRSCPCLANETKCHASCRCKNSKCSNRSADRSEAEELQSSQPNAKRMRNEESTSSDSLGETDFPMSKQIFFPALSFGKDSQ